MAKNDETKDSLGYDVNSRSDDFRTSQQEGDQYQINTMVNEYKDAAKKELGKSDNVDSEKVKSHLNDISYYLGKESEKYFDKNNNSDAALSEYIDNKSRNAISNNESNTVEPLTQKDKDISKQVENVSNAQKDSAAVKNDVEKDKSEAKKNESRGDSVKEKESAKVEAARRDELSGQDTSLEEAKTKRLVPTPDMESRYAITQGKNATIYSNKNRQDIELVQDSGGAIKASRSDPEAIQLVVKIAKEKDWEQIKVKGSEDFRRKMWHEASKEGIEVKGYTPSKEEQEAMTKYLAANKNIENTVSPIIEHSKKTASQMPELKTAEERRKFVEAVEKRATHVVKNEGVPSLNEKAREEMNQSRDKQSAEISR